LAPVLIDDFAAAVEESTVRSCSSAAGSPQYHHGITAHSFSTERPALVAGTTAIAMAGVFTPARLLASTGSWAGGDDWQEPRGPSTVI
jgi:hypothetical protein